MWYLIIPPIIVVLSLSFVLWYLSRKSTDPLVAARASRLDAATREKVSFVRTRTFFLHFLEKRAYRFKIFSLRMHNGLHNLTQSLKESQRRFQIKIPSRETIDLTPPVEEKEKSLVREPQLAENMPAYRRFFAGERGEKVKPLSRFPQEREEKKNVPTDAEAAFSRPMVSVTAIHPEKTYKRSRADSVREEDLIARIASNPKDFAAYEGLGDYYLENDNIKDAKECYRQVLKLSPVQRMVKIKIRRLEKLLAQKTD